MGFSMVFLGSVSAMLLLSLIAIFYSMMDETALVFSSIKEQANKLNSLYKTDFEIKTLNLQPQNATFNFLIENIGQEKLWKYDDFDILVTYDANVTGIKNRITANLAYNATDNVIIEGLKAVPDSDINSGNWEDKTSGNNDGLQYDEINEVQRDDQDFTSSSRMNNGNPNDQLDVSLEDIPDPEISTDHTVYYTYRKDKNGGTTLDLTVSLIEGTTTIASWTHTGVGTTWISVTQTLTVIETDSISNYSNLFLSFAASCSTCSGSPRSIEISWAGLDVKLSPDGTSSGIDPNEWGIAFFIKDYFEFTILNSHEQIMNLGILKFPMWDGGFFELAISTDNGKIDSINTTIS